MNDQTKKPKDCLTVTIYGDEHKLLMTYGLLSELAGMTNTQEQMLDSGFAHESRDEMMKLVLTKRGRSGVFEEDEVDLDALDIDTGEEILTWITGHLSAFFMRRLKSAQGGMEMFQGLMETLGTQAPDASSESGSPA